MRKTTQLWNGASALIVPLISSGMVGLISGCASPQPDTLAQLSAELPYIIEAAHLEGMLHSTIDYDDPVLDQRALFLTTYLDHEQARIMMNKLAFLDSKEPGKPIDLYISSDGGRGGDTLANFLMTLDSPVNTYALDNCASAAAIVLAAGTGRRYAFPTSRIAVHLVYSNDEQVDHRDYKVSRLDRHVSVLFWKTHSRLPEELYALQEEVMLNLTAEEALAFGIVDEIVKPRIPDRRFTPAE